jgi:murein DD-endopeptidase MepM/ murein hydrolase activator NlpD
MGQISKKTRNKIIRKKNHQEEAIFNVLRKGFKIIIFFAILGALFYTAFQYKIIPVNFFAQKSVFLGNSKEELESSFLYLSNYDFEYKYWALDYQREDRTMEDEKEEKTQDSSEPIDFELKNPKSEAEEVFHIPIKGEISSGFGMRLHPIKGSKEMHNGIDIKANQGDPYFAFAKGEVIEVGFEASLGNYIQLQHENGITSHYLHSSKVLVKKGQQVEGGEKIGLVGSTGYAVGPHLHFEVRKNNSPINPLEIIKKW